MHAFTQLGKKDVNDRWGVDDQGRTLDEETVTEMIAKIDVKKDGTFNFDEYVTLMMNGPGSENDDDKKLEEKAVAKDKKKR